MAGVRVLISGMGGELGSRIASLLEAESWVGSLEGIDTDPPRSPPAANGVPSYRRRSARPHRQRGDPLQPPCAGASRGVGATRPGVARHRPPAHRRRNDLGARRCGRVPGARVDHPAQRDRGLRAGVAASVTAAQRGRRRSTPPATGAGCWPTSSRPAARSPSGSASASAALRLAPILGPHIPSPLGRFLRMPAVPFSALADPPFAVIHQHDAADAFVAAVRARLARAAQHRRPGRGHGAAGDPPRAPAARPAVRARLGDRPRARLRERRAAPRPRARDAPPRPARRQLPRPRGAAVRAGTASTREVIDQLYRWPSVIHVPARRQVA